MIDLEKHYGSLRAEELVEIIESTDAYKVEVIDFCIARLDKMNISKEQLKSHSIRILKKRYYKYFTDGKYSIDADIDLDSHFLTIKEAKACFNFSREEYIKYLDGATRDLPI